MRSLLLYFFLISSSIALAETPMPPIEAYGELPKIRGLSISPTGTKISYIISQDEKEYFVAKNLDIDDIKAVDTTNLKTRNTAFINDQFTVLSASETTKIYGYRGKIEYTGSFAFDTKNQKINQLLRKEESLYPGQSGIGYIIGNLSNKGRVLMPAYVGTRYDDSPAYNLFSVDPRNGRGRIFSKGKSSTVDWFVDRDGTILAREDHHQKDDRYSIFTKRTGKWEKIYTKSDSPLRPFNLVGVKADKSALILIDDLPDGTGEGIYELDWNGEISGPFHVKDNAEIDSTLKDQNRFVFGVRYSGMRPSYKFFDEELDKSIQKLIDSYPTLAISIVDWTNDWSKIVIKASGGKESGGFYLYEPRSEQLSKLGQPVDIPREWIGNTQTIEYKAKDGTKIPAVLTTPANVENQKNLPTIILPHGGPESYDQLSYDWLAQYFSSRGYLVLQPNFRGSTGFGWKFKKQGRGEWAGLMQDDVSDGVKALVDGGFSDPDRICIVGASYGGYSALAGGAFTPDLYKCVIAVAPVSDLPRLLTTEKRENQRGSWVVEYWHRVIGDPKKHKQKLKDISPVNFADAFKAPVLLVHGNDDTVVKIKQSSVMSSALKKAGKEVEFVKVKGGDHWLSTSETRLETLQAIDSFIAKHNPAN